MRLNIIAIMTVLVASVASANPTPQSVDWQSLSMKATTELATAIDDAARGRPVAVRVRSTLQSMDRLLAEAPLSDRDRARIFYNRGLANLTLGDAGAAVLDLRRSDALAPGREATLRELATARAKLAPAAAPAAAAAQTKSEHSPGDETFGRSARNALLRVPAGAVWTGGLAAAALAWVLLGARLFVRSRPPRAGLGAIAAAAFAVAAAAGGLLAFQARQMPTLPEVVVTAESCTPRQGPDDVAYPATTLGGRAVVARGTELVVLEARALPEHPEALAWLRVREVAKQGIKPDSSSGVWVPASSVGWIREIPGAAFAVGGQFMSSNNSPNARMWAVQMVTATQI